MAFDCIGIDFHNSKNNIDIIKQKFSYVEIVPFIKTKYTCGIRVIIKKEMFF